MVVCSRGMGCGVAGFGGEEEAEKSELVARARHIRRMPPVQRRVWPWQHKLPHLHTHQLACLTPHTCYPNLLSDSLTLLPTHTTTTYITSECRCPHSSFACPTIDRNPQLRALEARGAALFITTPLTAPTFLSPNFQIPYLHAHPLGQLPSCTPWRHDEQSLNTDRRTRKTSCACV